MTKIIALLCLSLAACTSPTQLKGEGEAPAPYGYQKLCFEQPHLAMCPKAKP